MYRALRMIIIVTDDDDDNDDDNDDDDDDDHTKKFIKRHPINTGVNSKTTRRSK